MTVNNGGLPMLRASTTSTAPTSATVLWALVAPYVRSADLYSACLVSQLWHQTFAPSLWGDPGLRFGTANDDVCSSLTKFKRGLKRARYEVRSLTHTLCIPPATPELCEGPQRGWLRDCLDRLPFLQSLLVSGVAFFDHESLRTVRHSQTGGWERRKSDELPESPVHYGLRLLTASSCPNTTATSLASALANFPLLMYLDLSSTIGVRNPQVLRQITCLDQLQILKLQGCGLRDYDMQYLCFSDSNLLRSLDIRHNNLTEAGIATVLNGLTIAIQFRTGADREPWHVGKAEDYEGLVKDHLTKSFAHQAILEDDSPIGLSHLYVAGNDLSIERLATVLGDQQLRILDCGSLTAWQTTNGFRSPSSPVRLQVQSSPSVLNMTSFSYAFRNLTYLRIHHSIVTEHIFSDDGLSPDEKYAELDGAVPCHELDSTEIDIIVPEARADVLKLADTSGLVELPGDLAPQFELPNDSIPKPPPSMPISGIEPTAPLNIVKKHHGIFRKPFKPSLGRVDTSTHSMWSESVVSPSSPHDAHEDFPILSTSRLRNSSPTISSSNPPGSSIFGPTSHPRDTGSVVSPLTPHENFEFNLPIRPRDTPLEEINPQTTIHPRERSNENLIEEIASRRCAIRARERKPNVLLPSMLPNLRTLILTDVPLKTRSNRVANALKHFIQECAEEEALAGLEATRLRPEIQLLERHEGHTVKKAPRKTFQLRQLMLEMSSSPVPDTPPLSPRVRSCSTSTHRNSFHRNSFTKSSTEDADSETFMSASEMDFTFFGDDDCSLLVTEGRIDAPCSSFVTSEKMLASVPGSQLGILGTEMPLVDVIGELSKFRKSAKAAYEAHTTYGDCKIERALLGHWSGVISIVRLQSPS